MHDGKPKAPEKKEPTPKKGGGESKAKEPATPAPGSPNDQPANDYQLARAIDLLHGISLYNAKLNN